MVNLQTNPNPDAKIIKAGFVDKNLIDQAHKRIAEQQQKAEQLKIEAEQAKQAEIARVAAEQKALELATLKKAQMEVAAKAAAAKKVVAQEQAKKQQQAKQKALKELELKKVTERQAAAMKADKNRLQAEHNMALATEVEKFKSLLISSIKENKIVSSVFSKDTRCALRIQLLPDGSILSIDITEPSGIPAYDEMQISAVYKAAPFTMPEDHELYSQLREIVLSLSNDMESPDA